MHEEGGYAEFAVAKENEVRAQAQIDQLTSRPPQSARRFDRVAGADRCRHICRLDKPFLFMAVPAGSGTWRFKSPRRAVRASIATASTANQEFLHKLGADQTIDYTKTKFEEVVKDVDVVLDAVGGDTLPRSYGVVKKGGIIVTIAGEPDQAALDAHEIRGISISAAPKSETFAGLTRLIEDKKLAPVVTQGLSACRSGQSPRADRDSAHPRQNRPRVSRRHPKS